MKKVLCLVVALVLALGCAGGALAEAGQWKVGYNFFGSSSYALIVLRDNSGQVVSAFGGESVQLDDEFQVEKIIQDVENMIASGCDGLLIWLPAEQLYPTISEMCEAAKIPFVLNDKVPEDPEIAAQLKANPYCVGAIGPANAVYGKSIAQYALDKGFTNCITSSGDVADPSDAPRLKAFEEAFLAGGGEILETLHSALPTDIQPHTEDSMIAHPNPDFIYGVGPDFGNGACDALTGKGFDTVVLTSGLDSTTLERLTDPDSPMAMVSGDYWVCGMFSAIILQNYLDGTPLLDAEGNPVWYTDVEPFEVSSAQYDLYKKFFLDQFMYTPEELRQFSGANNPEFNYDAFMALVNNYSLQERLQACFNEGLISAEEMAAAGL